MSPEFQTLVLIGVGIAFGMLIMQNLALRRKVNHLEQQIQILLNAMGVANGYRPGLGGLGGASSGDGTSGGTG